MNKKGVSALTLEILVIVMVAVVLLIIVIAQFSPGLLGLYHSILQLLGVEKKCDSPPVLSDNLRALLNSGSVSSVSTAYDTFKVCYKDIEPLLNDDETNKLYYMLGEDKFNKGDYAAAVGLLGKLVGVTGYDDLDKFNWMLGDSYFKLGNNTLAKQKLESIKSTSSEFFIKATEPLLEIFKEEEEDLSAAVTRFQNLPESLITRSEKESFFDVINSFINEKKNEIDGVSDVNKLNDIYNDLIKIQSEVPEQFKKQIAELDLTLGKKLEDLGKPELAEDLYVNIINNYKVSPIWEEAIQVFQRLDVIYKEDEKLLTHYKIAIKSNILNSIYQQKLALLYNKIVLQQVWNKEYNKAEQSYLEAKQYLNQSLTSETKEALAKTAYDLAGGFFDSGNTTKAVEYHKEVFESYPGTQYASSAEVAYNSLK